LEIERARLAETNATVTRLEGDLAEAKSQSSEASRRLAAERETWLQQRAALQAGNTALEGELAETRSRLSSAVDLRAQRDSQIAQLRAEIEDGARQAEKQQKAVDMLEGLRREGDAARNRLESDIGDLRGQLEFGLRENEQLRQSAALLARRAEAADEQLISITHSFPALFEEISRLRSERDAISREKARLEALIAASPGARLRSLWRRLTNKREAL